MIRGRFPAHPPGTTRLYVIIRRLSSLYRGYVYKFRWALTRAIDKRSFLCQAVQGPTHPMNRIYQINVPGCLLYARLRRLPPRYLVCSWAGSGLVRYYRFLFFSQWLVVPPPPPPMDCPQCGLKLYHIGQCVTVAGAQKFIT